MEICEILRLSIILEIGIKLIITDTYQEGVGGLVDAHMQGRSLGKAGVGYKRCEKNVVD